MHGAKLLKKPHQATAVHAASHLWWQEPAGGVEEGEGEGEGNAGADKEGKDKEEGEDAKAVRIFFLFFARVRALLLTSGHTVPTPR